MPGTAAGTRRSRQRTVASATCAAVACFAHFLPAMTMFGFSTMPSRRTRCRNSASNTLSSVASVTSSQRSMRVVAVHQHFGLDDRDDRGLLAQGRVARERLGVRGDAAGGRDAGADVDDRAPLGEARAEAVVLGEPLAQAVEALGHRLARKAGERLGARVHLDAREDAARGEQLRERLAVGGLLAEGLVVQDHARDVLLGIRLR